MDLKKLFPPQPVEDPVQREVKNQLCIDGTLERALDDVLSSGSPDGIAAVLTGLAHRSVEAAFAAMKAPRA